MPAISYVGGKVAGRANPSAAVAINIDSGLAGGSGSAALAGDLVIVAAVTGSAGGTPAMAVTTPTGYTAIGQENRDDTADTSMNVSWKIMGGTPDTTVTIPGTGNNAFGEAYSIQVFRGVDSVTPMDVAAQHTGGIDTGRPDPPSITPATTGAAIVICGGGAAGTGANYTAPANYTDDFLTASGADTTDAMVGSGYRLNMAGGVAENPAGYTGGTTGTGDSWAAYTLALRPARDPIAGAADQSFSNTATLSGRGALAGSAAPAFAASGTLTEVEAGNDLIDGTAAIAFSNSATLAGRGALAGASNPAFTDTATLTGKGALAGSAAQSFGESVTLGGRGVLAGSAAPAFAPAATLTGRAPIAGECVLSFSVAGELALPGAINGVSTQAFSPTATLTGRGVLAGEVALTFGATVTLAVIVPVYGWVGRSRIGAEQTSPPLQGIGTESAAGISARIGAGSAGADSRRIGGERARAPQTGIGTLDA